MAGSCDDKGGPAPVPMSRIFRDTAHFLCPHLVGSSKTHVSKNAGRGAPLIGF